MVDRNYLFVCSQNRLRSPTAEHIFADTQGINTLSAGTNRDAENPLSDELVEWADFIFVMERPHRNKLQAKFRRTLKDQRVIVLDIPDEYEFMDAHLVRLLEAKMRRWLPMERS
ncbi:phosphotyrosine protein phosphatase [uncultured Erythrobacter sp.]|uniref:low molecular weight protein tyrosine phosphatase family protein n=1 Tax=uncultured Erythrobacter sp. TaxID=263913 RepID=UPI00261183AC|nr:phosphotyrosine protein phosphatase [uncultured Erythrobacter sp.]